MTSLRKAIAAWGGPRSGNCEGKTELGPPLPVANRLEEQTTPHPAEQPQPIGQQKVERSRCRVAACKNTGTAHVGSDSDLKT
jgi:hypothetical protein